jgi:exopolyphosphatase/guanosine-5'-triphosphate,3'-diphosphate pyrophosphatase
VTPTPRAGNKRHPYRRRRRQGRKAAGPVLGAIDVGTNACRLLIAVPDADRAMPRVIDSYTASVRLGEGLERAGTIAEAALDRTVGALRVCSDRLKRNGVTHVKAIATEACRRASNAQQLLDRAQAEAGICLVIVTPEEEARLAAEGCLPLIGDGFDGALIFDIGGGSTELILVGVDVERRSHQILAWGSAPIGVVSLAERHGSHQLPAEAYGAMRRNIASMFESLFERLGRDVSDVARFHLLGTSGTLTTLAGVKLGLPRYNRSRIDGQWLTRADVLAIMERIASQDFAGRAEIPCVGNDRADLIVPGCAILAEIMTHWPSETLRVADRGLREGLLIGLLKEASAARAPRAAVRAQARSQSTFAGK